MMVIEVSGVPQGFRQISKLGADLRFMACEVGEFDIFLKDVACYFSDETEETEEIRVRVYGTIPGNGKTPEVLKKISEKMVQVARNYFPEARSVRCDPFICEGLESCIYNA